MIKTCGEKFAKNSSHSLLKINAVAGCLSKGNEL